MPTLSAIDAVTPAIERTKSMLLRPFRLKKWMLMGVIGWLAGAGGGGSFNFSVPGRPFGTGKTPTTPPIHSGGDFQLPMIVLIVAVFVVVVLAISIAFLYLFSRFRFVLLDCVLSGQVAVERGWKLYREQAHRYFWLWLWAGLIFLVLLTALIGIPLLIAYKRGLFAAGAPSVEVIFAAVGLIFLGFLIFALLIFVLTSLANDFLVPLMAIDKLPVGSAWAELKQMIKREPGSFAAYLGLKLVLTFVAAFAMAIPMFVLFMIIIFGGIIVVVAGAVLFQHPGPVLIGAAIVLGVIAALALMVLFFGLMIFVSAPIAVFFTSYALLFLGGRYGKLGEVLWPIPIAPLPPPPPPFAPAPAV